MENKYLDKMLKNSMKCEEHEDWIFRIMMEFIDDNEGLSLEEFFCSNWISFYPNQNDLEFMDKKELLEYQNYIYNTEIKSKLNFLV